MPETKTIGRIIHPSWAYDLEASLRVQRMLVKRSLHKKWRFKDRWVTTGPFETLMGYPNCGSSSDNTSTCCLDLFFRDGLEQMVRSVNRRILNALCQYPDFASLNETIKLSFIHCGDAIDALGRYERGRTREQLNSHHKAARVLKDVRLACGDSGVFLDAHVSFNTKPHESRWGLFWLARQRAPKWNERLHVATWLTKAMAEIDALAKPAAERKKVNA